MIETIQALLEIQELDVRIQAAHVEISEFPGRRDAADADAVRARQAVEAAGATLADEQHAQRQLEGELRDVDTLIERLDGQVYEITSKQALEALQHQIAAARERKTGHEEAILERMEAIDIATETLEEAETRHTQGEAARGADVEVMAKRERELTAEIAGLEEKRTECTGNVEAGTLRRYETARRKRLPAVVFVDTKSCPVCRMAIAAQKLVDLRTANTFVNCASCDRILYGVSIQSQL